MEKKYIEECCQFIEKCPSPFHAIEEIKRNCQVENFEELKEGKVWDLKRGGSYYVTRNDSSIIAFKIGKDMKNLAFNATSSHSDSPTFRLKENCEIDMNQHYLKLNTEGYGSMIASSFFDRPLSLAGRVIVKNEKGFTVSLFDANRDLLLIPNVAIHMNREINNGYKYNLQVDLNPLLGSNQGIGSIKKLVANQLNVSVDQIISMELNLYNRVPASIWGLDEEYVSSSRLDDLECAYTTLTGFLKSKNEARVNVYSCFDNEEVGSSTKQGAAGTFLRDTLMRIASSLGYTQEDYQCSIASSFMVSADNAHAIHPNHPELSDNDNKVYMNEGIVIKRNASQKYTTDALSQAVFASVAMSVDVPLQYFFNRSDMQGGSTLGNISSVNVAMNSVDIGLAQLAMHSAYETAGVKDAESMHKVIKAFYETNFTPTDEGFTL